MMYGSAAAFGQEHGCTYGAQAAAGNGYYVHVNGYTNANGYHAQNQYDNATGSNQYGYTGEASAGSSQCQQSKTLCSFFMRGKCTKGAACSFSHEGPGDQQHQQEQSSSLAMQLLDGYSDWSDSSDEEEEVLEKPMEMNKLADLVLPNPRSIQEPDMEPAGEPSPCGMSAGKASSEDDSEGDMVSSTASEPDAEEPAPYTPCNDSWRSSVPVSPSKRFAIIDPSTRKCVEAPPPLKLEVSDNSWAAQLQRRKSTCSFDDAETPSDEQVARSIKSILNKLTVEKFDSLSKQLIGCGLRTAIHAELLIHELFEKATTQHHFIDMYADLCVLLHKHFTDHPFSADALQSASKDAKAISFKRLLLDECQSSFERRVLLSKEVDCEDQEAALRYKTHMLGNIKLVGALLSRSMLAGKVGIAILEELLGSPTPESLECVAVLLTTAGPAIDRPDWNYYAALNHFFGRIEQVMKSKQCKSRERFLLKDLLELRANRWVDKRPKKLERATTLKEVAEQANEEKPFLTLRSLRP